MGNRSLDDFLDDDPPASDPADPAEPDSDPDAAGEVDTDAAGGADTDPDASGETGPAPDAGAGGDATRADPADVEPAATTYAAGDGECVSCGDAVGERWRGEAGLVCPACKEW
jgi:hypothetical protein